MLLEDLKFALIASRMLLVSQGSHVIQRIHAVCHRQIVTVPYLQTQKLVSALHQLYFVPTNPAHAGRDVHTTFIQVMGKGLHHYLQSS